MHIYFIEFLLFFYNKSINLCNANCKTFKMKLLRDGKSYLSFVDNRLELTRFSEDNPKDSVKSK